MTIELQARRTHAIPTPTREIPFTMMSYHSRPPVPCFNFAVGDAVICNGYLGVIRTVHNGYLSGMVEVALDSGSVCTSGNWPDVHPVDWDTAEHPSQLKKTRRVRVR